MRNLSKIVVALVFGFIGAMRLGYMPKGLTAPADKEMGRTAQLISVASADDSVVEVNGVRFEFLVPERVWLIPTNQPNRSTPVKLGVHITNKTIAAE